MYVPNFFSRDSLTLIIKKIYENNQKVKQRKRGTSTVIINALGCLFFTKKKICFGLVLLVHKKKCNF